MKKIASLFLFVIFAFTFYGCERNDYQHPLHRAGKK